MNNRHIPGRPVAGSLYRQLRLTATLERSGVFSYSVYAKGLEAQWNEHTCLLRSSYRPPHPWPLCSTDDVIHALHGILGEQMIPGIE